jgi:hypothetical protein
MCVALQGTSAKPDVSATGSEKHWVLAVKEGPHGKPGRDGKDLTQLSADGSKW